MDKSVLRFSFQDVLRKYVGKSNFPKQSNQHLNPRLQNHLLKTTSFLMPHHESLFSCHPLPILSQHPGLLSSHRATYGPAESLATCPRDAATDGWSPSSFPVLPTLCTHSVSPNRNGERAANFPEVGRRAGVWGKKAAAKHLHPLNQRISTHFTTTTEMLPISTDGIARRHGESDSVSVCVCKCVLLCLGRRGGVTLLTLFQASNTETLLQKLQMKLSRH